MWWTASKRKPGGACFVEKGVPGTSEVQQGSSHRIRGPCCCAPAATGDLRVKTELAAA